MLRSSELPAFNLQRQAGIDANKACLSMFLVRPSLPSFLSLGAKIYMPKYIKLVHWLYEENRMVALTEVAKFMNVTLSGVHHYIKSIRKCEDIFQVRISQVDIGGRKQFAIRVLAIRPYKLIPGRRPVLVDEQQKGLQSDYFSMVDIWRVLVSKPWRKIDLLM